MQNQLPLALVEEQAERKIGAQKRPEYGDGECFEQPRGIDNFDLGGLLFAVVSFGCGAWHE
jgi:hypothetical protein